MSQTVHPKWKDEFKKDVVYLHVIPRSRARDVVNISPYAIKLELWLRMNNIPFQVTKVFSSKTEICYFCLGIQNLHRSIITRFVFLCYLL